MSSVQPTKIRVFYHIYVVTVYLGAKVCPEMSKPKGFSGRKGAIFQNEAGIMTDSIQHLFTEMSLQTREI